MKQILTVIAVLIGAMLIGISPANAVTCSADSDTPYKIGSGTSAVVGPGYTQCTGSANISVRAYLLRDGSQVDTTDHFCSGASECTGFATKNDISGAQEYCSWARAYLNGVHVDSSALFCESSGW